MKRFRDFAMALSITSMAAGGQSLAQQPAPMPGMAMPMPGVPRAAPVKSSATTAEASMMSAMETMSRDMAAVPMTGDADRDFAGMMIPHHQGAIDMAKFELAHGKDPVMLKLARAVVAAQDKEIALMKAWQAKHPAPR